MQNFILSCIFFGKIGAFLITYLARRAGLISDGRAFQPRLALSLFINLFGVFDSDA